MSQSDSASSTQSLTHGGVPELLLGLSYNATTGRMSVELVKGSHFRNLATNRPPGLQGALTPTDTDLLNPQNRRVDLFSLWTEPVHLNPHRDNCCNVYSSESV